jgi:hypothetical protein
MAAEQSSLSTAQWLASVYQNTDRIEPRIPLEIQDQVVGSVTVDDAQWFSNTIEGLDFDGNTLSLLPVCGPDASAVLARIADALNTTMRLGKWRNELLRVTNDSGDTLGMIERAAARALGIKTFAVHLVLWQGDQMWLQQRALDLCWWPSGRQRQLY